MTTLAPTNASQVKPRNRDVKPTPPPRARPPTPVWLMRPACDMSRGQRAQAQNPRENVLKWNTALEHTCGDGQAVWLKFGINSSPSAAASHRNNNGTEVQGQGDLVQAAEVKHEATVTHCKVVRDLQHETSSLTS